MAEELKDDEEEIVLDEDDQIDSSPEK